MSQGRFFLHLIILSFIVTLGLYYFHQLPRFHPYSGLSWLSLAFFNMLSIFMYYTGHRAAQSTNKHHFTNVVMGFTIGKMMISILIILGYLKLAEPDDRLFILPFFGIYLIYTIFETYFLTRLGKMNT